MLSAPIGLSSRIVCAEAEADDTDLQLVNSVVGNCPEVKTETMSEEEIVEKECKELVDDPSPHLRKMQDFLTEATRIKQKIVVIEHV